MLDTGYSMLDTGYSMLDNDLPLTAYRSLLTLGFEMGMTDAF
jgi:hypothetical protein